MAAALAIVIGGALVEADLVNLGSLIGLPLIVVAAKTLGLYDRDELVIHKTTLDDVPRFPRSRRSACCFFTVVQARPSQPASRRRAIAVLWASCSPARCSRPRDRAARRARAITTPSAAC